MTTATALKKATEYFKANIKAKISSVSLVSAGGFVHQRDRVTVGIEFFSGDHNENVTVVYVQVKDMGDNNIICDLSFRPHY